MGSREVFVPPSSDTRAVASLVLGAMSLVTCGLTGIPAIMLGVSARSAIARSDGELRGKGVAATGIVLGLFGTLVSLGAVAAISIGMLTSSRSVTMRMQPMFAPSPESNTVWAPAPPEMSPDPMTIGSIHVVDLDPRARTGFHQQLARELRRAASAHETVVVMTTAKWCGVCKEIQTALPDPRMQAALDRVDLVRVDVDDFGEELKESGMFEETLPWFYTLDGNLRPLDAISAGEWDENVPQNMAPVLRAFLGGTLGSRRDQRAGGGTVL